MASTPRSAPKPRAKKPAAKRPAVRRAPRKATAKPAARNVRSSTLLSVGALIVAAGATLTGFLARRQIAAWAEFPSEGYRPDDLYGDERPAPEDRAPDHFRPDATAPLSPADRAALGA